MSASDVVRVGTDPNGRAVLMTEYMRDWWNLVLAALDFSEGRPTIVQGAWMVRAGGGASTSAGYHDGGGCLDIRTWNLSWLEQEKFIRVTRSNGAASWRRDSRHGMDPHIHLLLGSDYGLASGARYQWEQYINGRDGLARNGADYEWRPSPLVLRPEEDDMPFTETQLRTMIRQEVIKAIPIAQDQPTQIEYPGGAKRKPSHMIGRIDHNIRNIAALLNPEDFANRVADRLAAQGGEIDKETVKQGMRELLSELADGGD